MASLHISMENLDMEIALDLWLTAHGGRRACLHPTLDTPQVLDFAKTFGMSWKILSDDDEEKDTVFTCHPEVFAHRKEYYHDVEYLRDILEYTFGKLDYPCRERAYAVPRIWADVKGLRTTNGRRVVDYTFDLFSYVAEQDTRLYEWETQRVEHWSRILQEYPFPFAEDVRLRLTIEYKDGVVERRKRVDDWTYVQAHYEEYYGDLMTGDMDRILEIYALMKQPFTELEWKAHREEWLRVVQK